MEEVHKEERQAAPSTPSAPPPLALATVTAVQEAFKVGNPIPDAHKWIMEKQEAFNAWLGRQSVPVEAAVSTTLAALQGGTVGGLISTFNKDLASSAQGMDPKGVNPFLPPEGLVGSPIVQARNFAVLTGTNAGISCVLKRVRGVDDVQNSMAAAFGSGFVFQLVSGTGAPNIAGAVGTGTFFALLQGGIHKLGQMMSKETTPTKEDIYYAKTRSMLMRLGLERYEKNFRKGLLTDVTLPLLTDSALRDVSIPPGPRLVILDHVQRDPELIKGR